MKKKFMLTLLAGVMATAIFIAPAARTQAAPQRIIVTSKRVSFDPGEITLKKGEPVIIVLTSKDVQHGLKFEEFNQVVKAKKGESNQVEFTPDKAGTFTAQCASFCGSGHGSMKLTVHVTE